MSVKHAVVVLLLLLLCIHSIHAAVTLTETFDASASGWTAEDAFNVSIYSAVFGNPAGALSGAFASQGMPVPRVGSFYADAAASAGSFVGNYSLLADFHGWQFDLYCADALPLSLQFVVTPNSGSVFTYSASLPTSVGNWSSVGISSAYSGAWTGGDEAALNATLADVASLEITVRDSSTDAVTYYMDNFSNAYDGGGGGSAVPEPVSMALFSAGILAFALFRKLRSSSEAGLCEAEAFFAAPAPELMAERLWYDEKRMSHNKAEPAHRKRRKRKKRRRRILI